MQSLQSCIGGSFNEDDTDQGATDMDDRTLVSYALDRLYREGARPAVFKVKSTHINQGRCHWCVYRCAARQLRLRLKTKTRMFKYLTP